MKFKKAWFYSLCFLYSLGIVVLGYFLPRSSFITNFLIFTTLFILYGYFYLKADSDIAIHKLLLLAVLVRLFLMVSLPPWSDDYVRFIWDGHLWSQGHSPYLQTPSNVLETSRDSFLEQLYPTLNSPDYYSVYPPSNQLVFAMAVCMAGEDLVMAVMGIRIFLLGFELLVFYLIIKLLKLLSLPRKKVLLYALNPLVIMEIVGNLHFEGVMLSFILTALLFLFQNKYSLSGLALGAAVAIKLSPLILVPSMGRYLSWGAVLRFLIGVVVIIILGFFPIFGDKSFEGFFESLGFYADYFEFNASIYYMIRQLGYWVEGYNVIAYWGPILRFFALLMILYISLRGKKSDPSSLIYNILAVYWVFFLTGTVVHPWYILPAFGISLFTGQKAFLIWTYLIFLSYHAYQQEPYEEKAWFLMVEYLVLLMALWADHKDWWRKILSQ